MEKFHKWAKLEFVRERAGVVVFPSAYRTLCIVYHSTFRVRTQRRISNSSMVIVIALFAGRSIIVLGLSTSLLIWLFSLYWRICCIRQSVFPNGDDQCIQSKWLGFILFHSKNVSLVWMNAKRKIGYGILDLVSGKEHLLKKGFEWIFKIYLPIYCMYQ